MGEFVDQEYFDIDQLLMEETMMQATEEQQQQHAHQQQQQDADQGDNSIEEHMDENVHKFQTNIRGRKQLDEQEKRILADEIMMNMTDGELPWGFLTKLAQKYGLHRTTTARLFNRIKADMAEGLQHNFKSNKFGKTGSKPLHITDEQLQAVPLCKRTKLRTYAAALNVSVSVVHKLKKEGRIRPHSSCHKPALTPRHKTNRLKWVLQHIHPIPHEGNPTYVDMKQVIHIDEKWFYLSLETRMFHLLPTEEDPYRPQQSKRFKVKAMFEAVIGKPLFDSEGTLLHSGNYGIFPFVNKVMALRNSKNRRAGTWETKAIQSVTKMETRRMLLEHVIPCIQENWPPSLPKDVYIQWDNAKPHQIPTDEEFVAACTSNGFNIQLIIQPAQSPYLNVLDLRLFRLIQSLQYETFPTTLDELIVNVKLAYDNFDPTLNKYTWINLQSCMTEILIHDGGNNYKVPHMGKAKLDRLGLLPELLEVDKAIITQAVHLLDTDAEQAGTSGTMLEEDSQSELWSEGGVDMD